MHAWSVYKDAVVAAFRIYAQCVNIPLEGEVEGCACNSHGNNIVDHGKIMEFCFLISEGTLKKVAIG